MLGISDYGISINFQGETVKEISEISNFRIKNFIFWGHGHREHYDCSDVSQTQDIFYPVFTTQDK